MTYGEYAYGEAPFGESDDELPGVIIGGLAPETDVALGASVGIVIVGGLAEETDEALSSAEVVVVTSYVTEFGVIQRVTYTPRATYTWPEGDGQAAVPVVLGTPPGYGPQWGIDWGRMFTVQIFPFENAGPDNGFWEVYTVEGVGRGSRGQGGISVVQPGDDAYGTTYVAGPNGGALTPGEWHTLTVYGSESAGEGGFPWHDSISAPDVDVLGVGVYYASETGQQDWERGYEEAGGPYSNVARGGFRQRAAIGTSDFSRGCIWWGETIGSFEADTSSEPIGPLDYDTRTLIYDWPADETDTALVGATADETGSITVSGGLAADIETALGGTVTVETSIWSGVVRTLEPLGWWRLEEASGLVFEDSANVEVPHPATAYDDIGPTAYHLPSGTVRPGDTYGVEFDGTQALVVPGKNMDDPDDLGLPEHDYFSIATIIQPTESFHVIAQRGSTWSLDLRSNTIRLRLLLLQPPDDGDPETGNISESFESTGDVPALNYGLVVATFDGDYARIYINGVETYHPVAADSVLNWEGHGEGVLDRDHTDMTIAALSGVSSPNPSYVGSMDDLILWDRALTGPEIVALTEAFNEGTFTGELVTEADAARAGTVLSVGVIHAGVAVESDTVRPADVQAGALVVGGGPAPEADTARGGTVVNETDGGLPEETDQALPGVTTAGALLVGGLPTETNIAQAGAIGFRVTGGIATEADTAVAGHVVDLVISGRAVESDTALVGVCRVVVTGGTAVETDAALAGTAVAITVIIGGRALEIDQANGAGLNTHVGTVRWVFHDPVTLESWTVPINPNSMTPIVQRRELSHSGSIYGTLSMQTGRREESFDFTGVIRSQAHYDQLVTWASKRYAVEVTDHVNRTFRIYITDFEATDRSPIPRAPKRWRYSMKSKLLAGPF